MQRVIARLWELVEGFGVLVRASRLSTVGLRDRVVSSSNRHKLTVSQENPEVRWSEDSI